MTQALVLGVVGGAVSGLLAVGLVLIYKGSRVFNFSQGEFGTVAAYVAWLTIAGLGWPYALGALAAVAAGGLMGLATERFVVRPLFDAPRVTLLVATGGLALASIQLQIVIGRPEARVLGPLVRGGGLRLGGVLITAQELLVLGVLGGMAAGLAWFFGRTRLGAGVLAASQDPLAAELVGIGSRRVSSLLWTMAGLVGGLAGLLLAGVPGQSVAPGFVTRNALIAGFAAAVLGGIDSIAGAFAGGVVIGVGGQFAQYFLRERVPSPDMIVLMGTLLLVLLVRPRGMLGREV